MTYRVGKIRFSPKSLPFPFTMAPQSVDTINPEMHIERRNAMKGQIVFRILFGILLIAGVVALGVYVYNAGVAQGLLTSGQLSPPANAQQTAPYVSPHFYYHPLGWGMVFFAILLGIFLVGGLVRMLFFRPWFHHAQRHWGMKHAGPYGFDPDNVPPMVAEWHRKLHETPPERGDKPAG
jgi:hypothetical protein